MKLAEWAANHNAFDFALSELLGILLQLGLDLPMDPRTLLSNLEECEVNKIRQGSKLLQLWTCKCNNI